jgi:hypothetical protein
MAFVGMMIAEPNDSRGSLNTWLCVFELALVC